MNCTPKPKLFGQWIGRLRSGAARNGNWTIPLRDLFPAHLNYAGAKAVTLGQLLQSGLTIPPGFVITAAAFQKFLKAAARPVVPTLAQLNGAGPDQVITLSRTLQEALAQSEIPGAVEQAIQSMLEQQPKDRLWAVRSSATMEDSAHASFAGQHDSFLNVPRDEVVAHVRRCWMSLFNARALSYRIRNNILHDRAAMAVIVQEMVPAEMAGVLFTADPASGESRIIIEGARGLGDQVVSGHVTPERVVLSKSSFEIIERTTGRVANPNGEPPPHPDPLPRWGRGRTDRPSEPKILDDAAARRLAELSLRVEQILGGPLDIEWAVRGGEIFLLQARPITGTPEARSWEDRQIWTNVNAGEVFPDAITPVTWSMLRHLTQPITALVQRLSGVDTKSHPIIGLVAGRVYFNLNTACAAIKPLSFLHQQLPVMTRLVGGGDVQTMRHLLQSLRAEDVPQIDFRWWDCLRSLPTILWAVVTHPLWRGDAWTVHLKARMDELTHVDVNAMSTPELARFFGRLAKDKFVSSGLVHLASQMTLVPVFDLACRRWLNDPQLTLGLRLFSALGAVPEVEAGLALWRLAALAHADDQTELALSAGGTWQEALAQLQQSGHGRKFLNVWNAFMSEHGHHCRGELELFNARWSEKPDYILGQVRGYLRSIELADPIENQRRLAEERLKLTAQCRQRLKNPLKRWLFSRSLSRAQRLSVNREEWKNQAVRQITALRRALLSLGERFEQQGLLSQRDDIFFLEITEIEAMGTGQGGFDARERIAARRKEYETNLPLKPPLVVQGRFSASTSAAVTADPNAEVLEGIPVSPGTVIGRAKVILRSDDHEQVLPGEILIAPFTDPAWTLYFVSAAGVAIDQGGILSHGSIVAREYGLPAVTSLGSAVKIIRTGDLVEVDGNRGRVTILKRAKLNS